MIPAVKTRANEPNPDVDEEEFEWVQEWKTTIPPVKWDDRDKIAQIKDNVEYVLRRHPFFLKPEEFSNDSLYLRPEYGTPSLEWDMVDIIDFTCELQNKFNIEISDEIMYLDFIQLHDVYHYLYALKKPEDAKKAASSKAEGKEDVEATPEPQANVAKDERTMLIFPGQGAQKVGMGKGLDTAFAEAKEMFAKAKEVLGYDLLQVCLNGPEEKLNQTLVSQPALYVTSMAALAKLRKEEPERIRGTVAACGLSLGEYTALAFAGVFSFEEGLLLVKARAEAMQAAAEAAQSGMVSVLGTALTEQKVAELAEAAGKATNSKCYVSNVLCPGNTTISGSIAACEKVMELGASFGASKTVKLNVAGAFHSEYMRPAFAQLKKTLSGIKFHPPKIPVIMNVDGQVEDNPEKIKEKLLEQLVKPVLWERSIMFALKNYNLAHVVEVGPGNVLTGLMRRILKVSETNPAPRPRALNV